jgi:hypothetical protein
LYPSLDSLEQEQDLPQPPASQWGDAYAEGQEEALSAATTTTTAIATTTTAWEVLTVGTETDHRRQQSVPSATTAPDLWVGEEDVDDEEQVGQVIEVQAEAEADWDSKPPARPPGHPPQVYYAVLQEEEEEEHEQQQQQQEATVVDYNVHPSELLIEAAPAELMGHDYSQDQHQHQHHPHAAGGDGEFTITPNDHYYRSTPYASSAPTSSSNTTSNNNNTMMMYQEYDNYQDDNVHALGHDQQVTEVSVIESGPMEKATLEAWSASTSGQAQVLIQEQDEATNDPYAFQRTALSWDAKPIESSSGHSDYYERWDNTDAYPTTTTTTTTATHYYETSGGDSFNMIIDGEAEIVDISEDVHPAELIGGTEATAEAELVGSDFNTAIGIPSGSQHFEYYESHGNSTTSFASAGGGIGEHGTITHADIIVEESNHRHTQGGTTNSQTWLPPREARATLVHPQSEHPGFDVNGGMATVVVESSSSMLSSSPTSLRSRSEPLPATTVTVLLEETSVPAMPPGVSFGDYVKSEPYSGPNTRGRPVHDQVFRETSVAAGATGHSEWERLPSFGGGGGESSVPEPMLPPQPPIAAAAMDTTNRMPPLPTRDMVASESTISSRSRSKGSNTSTSESSAVPGFQMVRIVRLVPLLDCECALASSSLPPLF